LRCGWPVTRIKPGQRKQLRMVFSSLAQTEFRSSSNPHRAARGGSQPTRHVAPHGGDANIDFRARHLSSPRGPAASGVRDVESRQNLDPGNQSLRPKHWPARPRRGASHRPACELRDPSGTVRYEYAGPSSMAFSSMSLTARTTGAPLARSRRLSCRHRRGTRRSLSVVAISSRQAARRNGRNSSKERLDRHGGAARFRRRGRQRYRSVSTASRKCLDIRRERRRVAKKRGEKRGKDVAATSCGKVSRSAIKMGHLIGETICVSSVVSKACEDRSPGW